MAKYAQFITHKGKRILFVNGSRLPEAETLVALEEMKQALLKEGKVVPVLIDMTGQVNTMAIINKSKEVTAATTAIGINNGPGAVVGLTGLRKAVAQLFSQNTHFFDSIDEAKEWLVNEDEKRCKTDDKRRQDRKGL